jgi:hypothetical protein
MVPGSVEELRPMTERLVDLDQIITTSDLSVSDSFKASQNARTELRLDELDRIHGEVAVRAPEDVTSMSTRFLIGLLQPSVEHFGSPDRFFEHYRIDGNPSLVSQIRRAVEYSLLPDTEALARSES